MIGLSTIFSVDEEFHPNKKMYAFISHLKNINKLFDDTIIQSNFYIFNIATETNDVYTLSQMMKLGDIKDFVLVMIRETEDHESRGH